MIKKRTSIDMGPYVELRTTLPAVQPLSGMGRDNKENVWEWQGLQQVAGPLRPLHLHSSGFSTLGTFILLQPFSHAVHVVQFCPMSRARDEGRVSGVRPLPALRRRFPKTPIMNWLANCKQFSK